MQTLTCAGSSSFLSDSLTITGSSSLITKGSTTASTTASTTDSITDSTTGSTEKEDVRHEYSVE